jgi:hypothetical protein
MREIVGPRGGPNLSIRRSRRRWRLIVSRVLRCVVLAAAIGFGGCGHKGVPKMKVYPTSGKVTVAGKPAAGLSVILEPGAGYGDRRHLPRATVGPDGTFQLRTYAEGDGAPAGSYTVRLAPSVEVSQPVSPEVSKAVQKYAKSDKLLSVSVKEQERNMLEPIELN